MNFNTAISGINAASGDLDAIGNNIANVGTTGFKSSRADFAEIYTGSGNTSPGSGVRLSAMQTSFNAGTLSLTNNTLDLGIKDAGFFILNDNGSTVYSRAGQFGLDNQNFITNQAGQFLQGINSSGSFGNLQVNTANVAPNASTLTQMGVNLNSTVGTTTASPYVAVAWAGGSPPPTNSYNYVSSSTIYDSLGNSHVLSTYFIKADSTAASTDPNYGNANTWYLAFQVDGADISPTTGTQNSASLYSVNFNTDGTYNGIASPGGTAITGNNIPISIPLSNGAITPLALNLDISKSTQFGSPYGVNSLIDDGYTTGTYAGLNIDTSGNISARYSNGKTQNVGTIQLANFANPQGLANVGDTNFAATLASGQPLISAGGTAGLGTINSGYLEESNVDLTGELVKLITAQRNFQANSQTIKTLNAVTQTIINM